MRCTQAYNVVVFAALLGLLFIVHTQGVLLHPTSSVLQLTSSMSVPIDLPGRRKVFMDLGFQMNYNLPFDPVSFYNPAIWADALDRRKRDLHNNTANLGLSNDLEYADSYGIHKNDFTAGELYAGLERLLVDYGLHGSCLQRGVCELALHPFDEQHSYNVVTKVITFLLTPSQHDGFAAEEQDYRYRYERAEQVGFLGQDCQLAYPDCELDLLSIVTRLIR